MKRLTVCSTSVLTVFALVFSFALTIQPAAAQDTALTLDLTASTTKAKIGDFVEFTVRLENTGTETIPGVMVNLELPDALDARAVNCPTGSDPQFTGVTTCILGDLSAGSSAEVLFYVEVGAKEPNGPVTATATSTNMDSVSDQLAPLKIVGKPNR
jgi:uncharacterized repeat protein (TIGR01451 family)